MEKAKCKNCTDEMIEEMAKEIFNTCAWRFGNPNDYKEIFNDIAEDLIKLNYRKIPEGSVVLSNEEYSDIIEDEVKTLKRDIAEYWACSDIDVVAQELHKDGYRKLDDHAIITLRKAKGLEERTRKETAEKWHYHITTTLLSLWKDDKITTETYNSWILFFNGLAKQFGVEIEE